MLEIGSIVDGKYKILNKIGQGGMSVVYLAMNERANKQWAIKEVRRNGVSNYEAVKQGLVAEIDMLKKLNHPNLPSIIDVIQDEDTFLIIMDYIEGNPLSKILKHQGAQSQEDVIEWSKQLCDVLGYLHSREKPIIYRDMKPSNVMLKPDGTVTLIDFGTAREYKERSAGDTYNMGTREYAAPEQYGGMGQTDARTDIYNLGATMYHLVTGHHPTEPPSYTMKRITEWNPRLSSGLEEIIIKCTMQDPNDRYQNCAELMYALEHYQELENETKREYSKKWRLFVGAASLCAVSLVGTVGFKMAMNSKIQSTYDYCIEQGDKAANGKDYEVACENYKDAINISPEKGTAYVKLVENAVLGDRKFDTNESTMIKEIIDSTDSKGNKYQNKVKKSDPKSYAQLMYDLGNAYYFYYENAEVGRNRAGEYYNNAKEMGEKYLDSNQYKRALTLANICEYIEDVRDVSPDGTSLEDASRLWEDLNSIVNTDFGSDYSLAIKAYDTFNIFLTEYENDFYDYNITYEDMLESLNNVKGKVDDIINKYENGDIKKLSTLAEKELSEVKDNIDRDISEFEKKVNRGTSTGKADDDMDSDSKNSNKK